MSNPLFCRIVARIEADDAVSKLHRHWSARGERYVNRVGYWLWRCGFDRLSSWYTDATSPLTDWFAHRQSVFLSRYF